MQNTFKTRESLIVYGIPLLMILSLIVMVKSSFFTPNLSPFVIIDFLITIPLVHFFLIRKKEISKKSIITVLILGFVISNYILPKENLEVLSRIQVVLIPLLETSLLVYIIITVRKSAKEIRKNNDATLDFFDQAQQVCTKILPSKAGIILATEIAVIYYSLLNWKKRQYDDLEYTYHKEGTAISLVLGFLLVVIIEMFVTHTMMKQGNINGSLVLGILSAYTALQVIAVMKSLSKRPCYIDTEKKQLILKFGILSKAAIPFENIEKIEISSKELPEKTTIKYFSPFGNSLGHNLVVHLKNEILFNSFYGFTKKATSLAIFIDQKVEFKNELSKHIS
ncbi:hypothetical protein DS884_06685 [Tenacibaculum sp. E3R01]|uniref:hypothetical protein n=1 Tax=Tenacibaculum sp. E3R01 TaxID=2267227 RepID=UPI000DEBEDA7|nr:hypothetical protein [Tenacibaculum sp. E3R01]RBW59420.1 hypothetical protein DS884_06685 [Tenacibaculum sp. E3R01]